MARTPRPKPARLPEKLVQIRMALGLSQGEMLRRLELHETLTRTTVSAYEVGTSEPPLPVLLKYARLVGISTDVLIDDEISLPAKLPAKPGHK
jgi:transcriptional regulator with XRE-family HTH domain